MKILYLTNIEVPYRVKFFNELAKYCDLTVLYERRKSDNRDDKWTTTEKKLHNVVYFEGINDGNENTFSFRIIPFLTKGWDVVIVGCYNSKVQIFAMQIMRLMKIPFIINLDGEPFIGIGIKAQLKKMALRGAKAYLIAGMKAAQSLKIATGKEKSIFPYYFSSLSDEEITKNSINDIKRESFILVIGQYYNYKGMDIAYKTACMDNSIKYKFVGMGKRTELFLRDIKETPENIEVIPFLQKDELKAEYRKCALMLLPSRQECWGLVINEAASFGTPIVSTWGSGAAIEFLADDYSEYLAIPDNPKSLLDCIHRCLSADNNAYKNYLKMKSKSYTIENSVKAHMDALNKVIEH